MMPSQKNLALLIFLLIASLSVTIPVFAFQNEPDGFRGIKWGCQISELSDMLPVEVEADAAIYVRKNDGMKFGDAELTNIRYVFYKARFSAVIIDFMNDLNFKQLKDSFVSQYGQGYQPNLFLEEIFWRGEKVNVYFHYDKVTEKGDIGYLFNPISKEYKRDQEKKTKK